MNKMLKEKKGQREDICFRLSIYLFIISFLIILIPSSSFWVSGIFCICALLFGIKSILRAKEKIGRIFLLLIIVLCTTLWVLLAYSRYKDESRMVRYATVYRTEADISELESALMMYREDWDSYPPSLSPYLLEGYIKKIEKDPWGEDYRFFDKSSRTGPNSLESEIGSVEGIPKLNYYIYSKGKDGIAGTSDDINCWDIEKSWKKEY